MNKQKMKSLASWLVIGVLGLVATGGLVLAGGGSDSSVDVGGVTFESCDNCTFNVGLGVSSEDFSVPEELLGASGTRFPSGLSADTTSPLAGEVRGTTLTTTGAANIAGTLNYTESNEALTVTSTITIAESGKTFYLSGSWQEHTLPATSTPGQVYRFQVHGGLTATTTIVTAGSINSINGTLIVNGAVVDCDDEDTIEFVDNLENVGDFIELRTDGTDWFIGASGGLTAGSITCSAT